MTSLVLTFAIVFCCEITLCFTLTFLPRMGGVGKDISAALTRTPGIDVVLAFLIWIPWLVSGIIIGWLGFVVTIVGQILAMQLWIVGHELLNREATQGPRIVGYLNKRFGWWRNNLALWVTACSLPVFFFLRLAEVALYPLLVKLLNFRSYKQEEWVNISRHKFEGLVGHDLIWCLYCDWMTGVYSLGAEMLRNVESFWCPIRFYNGKKCENCTLDFPDIDNGWVQADGTMEEVVTTLQEGISDEHPWTWLSSPNRESEQKSG